MVLMKCRETAGSIDRNFVNCTKSAMIMEKKSTGLSLYIMQEECKRKPTSVKGKCTRCDGYGHLNADGKPVYGYKPGFRVKTCLQCKGKGYIIDLRDYTKRLLARFSKVDQTLFVDFFRSNIHENFVGADSGTVDTILYEEISEIRDEKNALLAQTT